MRTASDVFGLSVDGGLHLPSARLWLDGKARGELAFVPELVSGTVRTGRILCSAELLRIWGEVPRTPLAPPFGERFRLGQLHLELLPAGSTAGAALLSIEGAERDMLIATAARLDTLPLAQPVPAFDADVIVIDAQLAAIEHVSAKQLREAVDAAIEQLRAGRRGLVWLFDDAMIALSVAAIVGDRAPLFGSLGFKRWQKRHAAASLSLPTIRRLGQRAAVGSFVLWPVSRAQELAVRDVDDFAWTLAAERADSVRADHVGAEQCLPVSRRATGKQLDQLVIETGAKDVVALGAGAGMLADRLMADPRARDDLVVWHLVDQRQMTLWK